MFSAFLTMNFLMAFLPYRNSLNDSSTFIQSQTYTFFGVFRLWRRKRWLGMRENIGNGTNAPPRALYQERRGALVYYLLGGKQTNDAWRTRVLKNEKWKNERGREKLMIKMNETKMFIIFKFWAKWILYFFYVKYNGNKERKHDVKKCEKTVMTYIYIIYL